MGTDIRLEVGGDASRLRREIERVLRKRYSIAPLDSRGFSQPLGKIRGELGEFQKSLEASNARVLAFGASAGAIYMIGDALKQSVKHAIAVEKSLSEINVVLNLTTKQLEKFGTKLFDIAGKTGQSFQAVAVAATELSRQGLGVTNTLKRLTDAMMLARLGGMSTVGAVESLTAALNSFNRTAITSNELVNKMAAVDAAFAVSSRDLAEAIKRVASTASTAGVSIDQLMAIVTSAQQTTARGGNVIGNSFKTIFTRIQRPRVLENLRALGIAVKDSAGASLPLMKIMENLAKSFDTLGAAQQAQIAELVGGVFQINILKATMADLSKTNSVYSQALRVSANAADEANDRNKQLNQTLSAKLNKTLQNLTKTAAGVGKLTFGPLISNVTDGLNSLMDAESEVEGMGMKLGKGLLSGIGQFIAGPGVMIITATLVKIFGKLAAFTKDAFAGISGIQTASQKRAALEKQIAEYLGREPALIEAVRAGVMDVNDVHDLIISKQRNELSLMNRQKQMAAEIATAMASGTPMSTTARGNIPRYQKDEEQRKASAAGAGKVASFQGPGTIDGKPFTMNSKEAALNVPWSKDTAVVPTYGSVGDKAVEKLSEGYAKHENFAKGTIPKKKASEEKGQLSKLAASWVRAVRANEDVGATMGLGRGGTESRATMPQMGDAAQAQFEKDLQAGTGIAGQMTGGKKIGIQFGGNAKVKNLKATQKDIYGSNVLGKLEGAFGEKTWDKAGPTTMPGWLTNPVMVSQRNKILDGHHRWATVYARDAIDDGKIGGLSMQTNKIGLPIQQLLQLAESYSGAKAAGGETTVAKIGAKKKKKAGGHIPRYAEDKIGTTAAVGKELAKEGGGKVLKDTDIGGAAMLVPQFNPEQKDTRVGRMVDGIMTSFPVYGPQKADVAAAMAGETKAAKESIMGEVADIGVDMSKGMGFPAKKSLVKSRMAGIQGIAGAAASAVGGGFEAAVQAGLQGAAYQKGGKKEGLQRGGDFDLRAGGVDPRVRKVFGMSGAAQADIKNSASDDNQKSFARKMHATAKAMGEGLFDEKEMKHLGVKGLRKGAGGKMGKMSDAQRQQLMPMPTALGYIPRFQGDLANVMDKEVRGLVNAEGMSSSAARKSVYAATDPRIKGNKMGVGVFNRLHEPKGPGGMSNGEMRNGKGRGFIPRYQAETMGGIGFGMIAGLGSQIAMLGAITNKANKELEETTSELGEMEQTLQEIRDAAAAVEAADQKKKDIDRKKTQKKIDLGRAQDKKVQLEGQRSSATDGSPEARELDRQLVEISNTIDDTDRELQQLADAADAAAEETDKARKRSMDKKAEGVDKGLGTDTSEGGGAEAAIEAKKAEVDAMTQTVAEEEKFQGHLQTASMVLPMVTGVLGSMAGEGSKTAEALQGITQGAQIAMMAMMTMKGPTGMVVGAVAGLFVAAVQLSHTFSSVHQTAVMTKRKFEEVNAKNTRLVESLDAYTAAADKMAGANDDLSMSAATVLRLQKNQAVALSNVTDQATRMAIMMAADSAQRADAIANAKATAQAETARAKSAADIAAVAEDQAGGWEKWTFGAVQNDDWDLDGDLGNALDQFGSLAAIAAENVEDLGTALDMSTDEVINMQVALAQIEAMGKKIIAAMDPKKFEEFEKGMRGIGSGGMENIANADAEESIKLLVKHGQLSADQAAAILQLDAKERAVVIAGLKEQVVAAGNAMRAEKALSAVRQRQKAINASLEAAVERANSALEAAINNFYLTAQHISLMAQAADELREKVGFANREIKMTFQKETLKTAGPRLNRADKEKGDFAIKKAEFQQKAIKEGKATNRITKTDIAKPLAAGLKNAMSKIKADPKTGKIDAVGLEKQRKIQQAQLELSKLEARRESLSPDQYAAEMKRLTNRADIKQLIPNIAAMQSDIKRALDKGNVQRANQLVEMSKQKIIMENARREQLKRLQADRDTSKMGGIKAFLDPKSMGQVWSDLQTETGKLVAGGNRVEQGRSAMKVAMSLKDLTGAQSMAELGGLGDMAIEGRGEDIKQKSLGMAKMLKTRAAQTNDPRVRQALLAGAAKAEQNAARSNAIAKEQVERTLQLEKAPLDMVRLLGSINSVLQGQAPEIGAMVAEGVGAYAGVMQAGAEGAAFARGGPLPPSMVAAQTDIVNKQRDQDRALKDQKGFKGMRDAMNEIQAKDQEALKGTNQIAASDWQNDADQAFSRVLQHAKELQDRGRREGDTEMTQRGVDMEKQAKDFFKRVQTNDVSYNMAGPPGSERFVNYNNPTGSVGGIAASGGPQGGGGANPLTNPTAFANASGQGMSTALGAYAASPRLRVHVDNSKDIYKPINREVNKSAQLKETASQMGGMATSAVVYGGGGYGIIKYLKNQGKIGKWAGNLLSKHLPSMSSTLSKTATRFPTITKYLSKMPGMGKVMDGVLDSVKLAEKGPGLTAKLMSKSNFVKNLVQGVQLGAGGPGSSFATGAGGKIGGVINSVTKGVSGAMSKVTNSSAFTKVFGTLKQFKGGQIMPTNVGGTVSQAAKGGQAIRTGGILGKGGSVSRIAEAFRHGLKGSQAAKTGGMATSMGRGANAVGRGLNAARTAVGLGKGGAVARIVGPFVKGIGHVMKPVTTAFRGGMAAAQAGSSIGNAGRSMVQSAQVGARMAGAGSAATKGAGMAANIAGRAGALVGATKLAGVMGTLGKAMPVLAVAAMGMEVYNLATDWEGTTDTIREAAVSGEVFGVKMGVAGTAINGALSPISSVATLMNDTAGAFEGADSIGDVTDSIIGLGQAALDHVTMGASGWLMDKLGIQQRGFGQAAHEDEMAAMDEGRRAREQEKAEESEKILSGELDFEDFSDDLLGNLDVDEAYKKMGGHEIFATGGIASQQKAMGLRGTIDDDADSWDDLPTDIFQGIQNAISSGNMVDAAGNELSFDEVENLLKNNLPALKAAMEATRNNLADKRENIVKGIAAELGISEEKAAELGSGADATALIDNMKGILKDKANEKKAEMAGIIEEINKLKAEGMSAGGITQVAMDTPTELLAMNKMIADMEERDDRGELSDSEKESLRAMKETRSKLVELVNTSKKSDPGKVEEYLKRAAVAQQQAQAAGLGTEQGQMFAAQARELSNLAGAAQRQGTNRYRTETNEFGEAGQLMTQEEKDAEDLASIRAELGRKREAGLGKGGHDKDQWSSDAELDQAATALLAQKRQREAAMAARVAQGTAYGSGTGVAVGGGRGGGGTDMINPATGTGGGMRFRDKNVIRGDAAGRQEQVATQMQDKMTLEHNAQATRMGMLQQLNNNMLQNAVMIKAGNERWTKLVEILTPIQEAMVAMTGEGGAKISTEMVHSGKMELGALTINANGLPAGLDEALKEKIIEAIHTLEAANLMSATSFGQPEQSAVQAMSSGGRAGTK